MNEKELVAAGYTPQLCKVGTLYFNDKDRLFCKFVNEDTVDVRSYGNDMISLGKAKTFDEIKNIKKLLLKAEIDACNIKLNLLKKEYNKL